MPNINIDSLSEEELIGLNHKIVARLRFLGQMRSHATMLDFRIGERVGFRPPGRPEMSGILTRYNKKTVTVITDSGEHWNIGPGLLLKLERQRDRDAEISSKRVVRFPGRGQEK
jgi:hypothetical protein